MTWQQAIVAVAVALLSGAGLADLIRAVAGRRRARADEAQVLTSGVLQWAERLKKDADEAHAEVAEVRRELRSVRAEAHALADELRALRLAILHPTATIDGLRSLVQRGSAGTNGQH